MRVVGREAEAVVLLEVLIGSHTDREEDATSHLQPELRHKANQITARRLMWKLARQGRSEGPLNSQPQLK